MAPSPMFMQAIAASIVVPEPTEAFSDVLDANTGGRASNNVRVRIPAVNLSGSGSSIRVTFEAGASEGVTILTAWIGEAAGSGDIWDFTGDQVQLLFGGDADTVLALGTSEATDFVSYSYDSSNDIIISTGIGSATDDGFRSNSSSTGNNTYYKESSSGDSGVTAPGSGYTTLADRNTGILLIEVQ